MCDDRDVFVLLAVYVSNVRERCTVLMEAFDGDRSLIDITENASIFPSLIAAHVLSGTIWLDSVPKLYGIGKKTVVKILQQNFQLTSVGDINSNPEVANDECTKFIAACYGDKKFKTMSEARFAV